MDDEVVCGCAVERIVAGIQVAVSFVEMEHCCHSAADRNLVCYHPTTF